MSVAVVHVLEVVDVQHDQPGPARRAGLPGPERLEQRAPVAQPGQRIGAPGLFQCPGLLLGHPPEVRHGHPGQQHRQRRDDHLHDPQVRWVHAVPGAHPHHQRDTRQPEQLLRPHQPPGQEPGGEDRHPQLRHAGKLRAEQERLAQHAPQGADLRQQQQRQIEASQRRPAPRPPQQCQRPQTADPVAQHQRPPQVRPRPRPAGQQQAQRRQPHPGPEEHHQHPELHRVTVRAGQGGQARRHAPIGHPRLSQVPDGGPPQRPAGRRRYRSCTSPDGKARVP